MSDVQKSLKAVNEELAAMITGLDETEPVEKTMTLKEFLAYAQDQLKKAAEDEDPKARLEHLAAQIEKAMGFDDVDGMAIPTYTDASLSLSGQTVMADVSNFSGEPPGAKPHQNVPLASTPPSSTQGFDDTSTGGVSGTVTTPGGVAVPPAPPPGSTQGFDDTSGGGGTAGFQTKAEKTEKSEEEKTKTKKAVWPLDLAAKESEGDDFDFGSDVQ